jgi:hypothetical protein
MDPIKIKNFGREYPGKQFPIYKTLSNVDAQKIKEIVATKLNMPENSSSLKLVNALEKKSSLIPGADAESDNFNLKSTLSKVGISPNEHVFLNWYRFDRIDEIGLDDLSAYFDDIWYPAADYIDVFDNSLSWIVSIGYSGEVMVIKFLK